MTTIQIIIPRRSLPSRLFPRTPALLAVQAIGGQCVRVTNVTIDHVTVEAGLEPADYPNLSQLPAGSSLTVGGPLASEA